MIEQLATSPAQSFLQHRAGHAGVVARQQTRGVKLNHFHVAKGEARTQCHSKSIATFIARGGVVFVHGGATACCKQHGLGLNKPVGTGTYINH